MSTLRAHVLLIVASGLLLAACLSEKARDSTLLSTMKTAWPGVQTDVMVGIADAVAANALPDPKPLEAEVAKIDKGLASDDRAMVLSARWSALLPYGHRGIAARVKAGQISFGVGEFQRERLANFGTAFQRLHDNPPAP